MGCHMEGWTCVRSFREPQAAAWETSTPSSASSSVRSIEPVATPDFGKGGRGLRAGVGDLKTKGAVAPRAVPRQQPVLLEYESRPPGCCDPSALDRIEAGQCPEQSGLAAAAFAEQGDEFS